MPEKIIPLASMEKIIKKLDSTIRVSDNAKVELKNLLEEKGREIAGRAWELALHAGRKTIKKEDILLAIKK